MAVIQIQNSHLTATLKRTIGNVPGNKTPFRIQPRASPESFPYYSDTSELYHRSDSGRARSALKSWLLQTKPRGVWSFYPVTNAAKLHERKRPHATRLSFPWLRSN